MAAELTHAMASLRHLYANMINGAVRDPASAKRIAEGILSRAIQELEVLAKATQGAEPVTAWMNPETLDVIHDQRKEAWMTINGAGGKMLAKGYTERLYTAPPPTADALAAIEAARVEAEKLRADILVVRAAGAMLSNCAFNLAQRNPGQFTARDIMALDDARKSWDEVLRSLAKEAP
ncbi:MAG: hypothetical protein DI563_19390 [Variovorax paradoxus]|uniref:Uncharacterized protein n=1 Tax=Variovorax paradoxus TaxID=34073 RepID=A0A2W5Q4I2_VARPD|nr:MAG: hypothetical protein DI563_19390 [Variovorax paradoxus]